MNAKAASTTPSVDTITGILADSDRPHAATALGNVERLAEIHEWTNSDGEQALAPFVEGYCHYLATGKGQGALDSLRGTDKELYSAIRGKIIEASGVTRMTTRSKTVDDKALASVAEFLGA